MQVTPVRMILETAVNLSLTPLLKAGGFRKRRLAWRRRRGRALQFVGFQGSRSSTPTYGRTYVNVGLAFDRIRTLDGRRVTDSLSEVDFHFRGRLEELVQGAPSEWRVTQETSPDDLARDLNRAFVPLLERFEALDSEEALLDSGIRVGVDEILRARLEYACGRMDAASRTVRQLLRQRGDRVSFDHYCAYLGFEELIGSSWRVEPD